MAGKDFDSSPQHVDWPRPPGLSSVAMRIGSLSNIFKKHPRSGTDFWIESVDGAAFGETHNPVSEMTQPRKLYREQWGPLRDFFSTRLPYFLGGWRAHNR